MTRMAPRYALLAFVGFGFGLWLNRPAPSTKGERAISNDAQLAKNKTEDSKDSARQSFSRVLELGRQGGGLRQDAALQELLRTMRAEDFREAVALWTEKTQAELLSDEVRVGAIL